MRICPLLHFTGFLCQVLTHGSSQAGADTRDAFDPTLTTYTYCFVLRPASTQIEKIACE
jgi:hypothetical protein